MVTCNKILLAQHGRRETKLKLNTVTLREALLAHTNKRGIKQTNQAWAFKTLIIQLQSEGSVTVRKTLPTVTVKPCDYLVSLKLIYRILFREGGIFNYNTTSFIKPNPFQTLVTNLNLSCQKHPTAWPKICEIFHRNAAPNH